MQRGKWTVLDHGVTELKRLRTSFSVSIYFLKLGRAILLKLKVIASINRRHKFLFFIHFCTYQPELYWQSKVEADFSESFGLKPHCIAFKYMWCGCKAMWPVSTNHTRKLGTLIIYSYCMLWIFHEYRDRKSQKLTPNLFWSQFLPLPSTDLLQNPLRRSKISKENHHISSYLSSYACLFHLPWC